MFVLGGQRIDQKSKKEWKKEREKREDEKGSHCFFKSSGYDKVGAQASKLGFFKLIECIIKMSWCETECKNMCIGEQKTECSLYLRKN